MTDRAAELEAALRVWDSDDEIGNAAVAATTFQGQMGRGVCLAPGRIAAPRLVDAPPFFSDIYMS
jgi:hypothetical protein